ncbi:STAS domain-containing protein [Pseudemcibacter aquimaris]|uniref:STAS domain-containing protein n=1 Tax=Pseudemcibacter aquimaris TaxID=2857064 RepID=UPI0020129C7F|nr:STAS domain-containing protein [Pseudemcibacter aquimaris]MCC3861224.1 STAS domain-containing protein [Pseudemcibacter aquimaris]WDU57999.1 STAS domain-containing protein [Pseudemcibacter aquimaris]
MTDTIKLSPVMDLVAANDFKVQLESQLNDKSEITIDGSEVERILTPCIQLIVATDNELKKNNSKLIVTNASDAFISAVTDLGLEKEYKDWSS